MKKKGYTYFSGFITLCFCIVLVMGVTVPAQADDGMFGGTLDPDTGDPIFGTPVNFNDPSESFTHYDADPYKGFFMLYTQNNTGTAWTGMNFSISSATNDAVFIDTATWDATHTSYPDRCQDWAYDGSCDPIAKSSIGVSSWNITNGGLNMSVTFNNTWDAGSIGWIRVYTDNSTSSNGSFNISVSPVLVPEPISSTLFIVGAASLGARRFWKKRKTA